VLGDDEGKLQVVGHFTAVVCLLLCPAAYRPLSVADGRGGRSASSVKASLCSWLFSRMNILTGLAASITVGMSRHRRLMSSTRSSVRLWSVWVPARPRRGLREWAASHARAAMMRPFNGLGRKLCSIRKFGEGRVPYSIAWRGLGIPVVFGAGPRVPRVGSTAAAWPCDAGICKYLE